MRGATNRPLERDVCMEKFYFNKQTHTYERKNIPTFKEWCVSQRVDIPEQHNSILKDLMEAYQQDMDEQFPMNHYMHQDIRVLQLGDVEIILEIYVDEEDGIVHLMDLSEKEATHIADVVEDRFFQHLYEEDPSLFQKESVFDYRYFIYSKDGIVSEWRHGKLWFEKHFDVELKVRNE